MIYLANAIGETDGSMMNMLLNLKSDIPIVLISRPSKFVFNNELKKLDKYVLADVCEYGHDVKFNNTHIFGENTQTEFANLFVGDEWKRFDEFINEKPPLIYFKRELLNKDRTNNLYPIEYAAWFEPPPIVSRDEFEVRPIQVFNSWGYSSEYRRQLHGKIWTEAYKYGYMVCDNIYYLKSFLEKEENPKKWVSLNIPWYARHPMNEILQVQGLAKVSISHWGAGKKCFRSAEAPLNAVMALPNDDYAWTFDWVNHGNCIKFKTGEEVGFINTALELDWLYDIYVNGVENCRNYYLPNYLSHLEKIINGL